MAKLAASEAATAIAHQVTTSIDISDTQHAEREFVLLHKCLGKAAWNLLDFFLKKKQKPNQPVWLRLVSTAVLLDCGGCGQGFVLACGSCIIKVFYACCCPGHCQNFE